MATKTDNANLPAKLELRRYFLQKYHADGSADVFDCCQGDGVLWEALRREVKVASYWGVDVKKKAGRLQIDSARVLAQRGWRANVVDVDTYGSPWAHWSGLVATIEHPCTVFLTIGQWQMGTDRRILLALGCGGLKIPPGIACKLHELGTLYLLHQSPRVRVLEAQEAPNNGSARYLGLRIAPTAPGAPMGPKAA